MTPLLRRNARILKYVAVGVTCFSLQFILLTAMVHLGTYRPIANSAAFAVSAQLNFLLSSKLTWGDRPTRGWRHSGGRWAAYNCTALLSLACDSVVFASVYRSVGTTAAAVIGVITATCLTYLVCNRVVFRPRVVAAAGIGPVTETAVPQLQDRPRLQHRPLRVALASGPILASRPILASGRVGATATPQLPDRPVSTVAARRSEDGVTVVLPAYREEANLASTVEDMLSTLETAAEPHQVVIVNDGSPDGTGAVAEALAARYPGRIEVVHHKVNQGYGAAVRTGIREALERTDSRRLFLTDSDGQFKAADLPGFIEEAQNERADAVIGFRTRRADPPLRKINAFFWGWACRILLRLRARDIDCAYKLVDRRVLDGVRLRGAAATISPELLRRLEDQGARVLQRPVEHFPRLHGEPTGANLPVILQSLRGLIDLWLEHVGSRWTGRARRLVRTRDSVLWWLTALSALASEAAFLYFAGRHVVLAYPDAISHMLIARRVLEASTPGVAQLGAVWLPLPHLLMLPIAGINSWYYSGLAGSLPSMISYVLTTRYLYLTGVGLTGNKMAGLVAAVFFAANPNVLYMQSTPMTELLLIACIAATVYHLMRWCQTGSYRQLAATAVAALLGTLARYEAWVIDAAVIIVVLWVTWQRERPARLRERLRLAEGQLIFYATVAFAGIVGWVLWNAVIFHNPLYFQDGAFAKPSLWVSTSDVAVGHWRVAAETYLYAITDNVGWLALGLAAIGLGFYLARTRLRAESLAPLVPLVIIPFYVYALYAGQRPLHVMQISGSLYNVRFGLLTILPVALFLGYLAVVVQERSRRWLRSAGYAVLCCAVVAASALIVKGGIDTLAEAQVFQASANQLADNQAAVWLDKHYNGGKVLMESFGNEAVTFESQIPIGSIIYEGSYRQWQPALRDPFAQGIRWIYMRHAPGGTDGVWQALHGSDELSHYSLVYATPDQLIYQER
jgi:glycosyltransferase involved in cell wall biosynthesis/putative flippase GtrA